MRVRRAIVRASTFAALAAEIVAGDARPAAACAACGCGDPTLTVMGAEKPYAGRIRASIGAQYRTDRIGAPRVSEIDLAEQRLDVQASWAPWDRLALMITVPTLRREATYVNLARRAAIGLGDVEVLGKFVALQDAEVQPRHLFALVGGVRLPTGPEVEDTAGEPLPTELQPGTGSVDPIGGLAYAWFPRPTSVYVSAIGTWPTEGRHGNRASPSLRTTAAVQRQLWEILAPRLAVDARLDGEAVEEGVPEHDSSGFVAFVAPELVVAPVTDLVLSVYVRVPLVQALRGDHVEGPMVGGSAAYDF